MRKLALYYYYEGMRGGASNTTSGHSVKRTSSSTSATDINIMIVTAALLLVLLLSLCLHFAIRCLLRRLCIGAAEAAARSKAAPPPLSHLPSLCLAAAPPPDAAPCAICLLDFAAGDNLRLLPSCHHSFHAACVDSWLSSHPSCPSCRSPLPPPPPSSPPPPLLNLLPAKLASSFPFHTCRPPNPVPAPS